MAAPAAAISNAQAPQHDQDNAYLGDDACRSCHADKVKSFHQTAHYATSEMPDEKTIRGSFAAGNNVLKTGNPGLFFRMEERSVDGKTEFFQTAVHGTPPLTNERSEQFAFVVGSGEKGQTYLYWTGDELFELPVSYWKDLGWVNSPGFPDGMAFFGRPIVPR